MLFASLCARGTSVCVRLFAGFTFLIAVTAVSPALAGPTEEAVAFLQQQQISDGSFRGTEEIATAEQATAQALHVLGPDAAERAAALQFLQRIPLHQLPTEHVARRLLVEQASTSLLAELQLRQNLDGSFGAVGFAPGNLFDTIHTLWALAAAESVPSAQALEAVEYLLEQQRSDGSFAGSTPVTAEAVLALAPYRRSLPGVGQAVSMAGAFVLSTRDHGDWNESHVLATALSACLASGIEPGLLEDDVQTLLARQESNGSWANDVFTTAHAFHALRAFDAFNAGIDPDSDTGAIAGRVVYAGNSEPVANAQLFLATSPGLAVETDDGGRFLLNHVMPGPRTVVAAMNGMTTATAAVDVQAGVVAHAPDLVLNVSGGTARVSVQVLDATNASPLDGVRLQLGGPVTATLTAGAQGGALFPPLLPGTYAVQFSRDGFRSETLSFSVTAGEIRNIRQALLPADAYDGDSPIGLALRIVDGISTEPLAAATVDFGDRLVVADSAGRIVANGLVANDYTVVVGAAGHASRVITFRLPSGLDSNLGDIAIFPSSDVTVPESLDVQVQIRSGLDGSAISGANITVVETGATYLTDSSGRAAVAGLEVKDPHLAVSADGFLTGNLHLQSPGFGSYAKTFMLSPLPTAGRESTTLRGTVTDETSGLPVSGARIKLLNSVTETVADANGNYALDPITTTAFSAFVSAPGYRSKTIDSQVAGYGDYALNVALSPGDTAGGIEIASLTFEGEFEPGVAMGQVTLRNIGDAVLHAALSAEVTSSAGEPQGVVEVLDASGNAADLLALMRREVATLQWRWQSGRVAAATYRLGFRVSQPGSASRELPFGILLAQRDAEIPVGSRSEITGSIQAMPPVIQAGSSTPVVFNAVLINSGNTRLENNVYRFSIVKTGSDTPSFSAEQIISQLEPGDHIALSLGDWMADSGGDYQLRVVPVDSAILGEATGTLYVGDLPGAIVTVDRDLVLPGDHLVKAALHLQGIDLRTGTSVDPLSVAIRDAMEQGTGYVMPKTRAWASSNRCLGCHIQNEALVAMEGGRHFVDVPQADLNFSRNSVISALRPDGSVMSSNSGVPSVQTSLALWSLSELEELDEGERVLYEAAQFMLSAMQVAGEHRYWLSDHPLMGWWRYHESMSAMVVKGMSRLVREMEGAGVEFELPQVVPVGESGNGSRVWNMIRNPDDGALYLPAYNSRRIERIDPQTGARTVAAANLPFGPLAVRMHPNDGFYAAGDGGLVHVKTDGTFRMVSTLPLWDFVLADDGSIYGADRHSGSIWHIETDGNARLIARGGAVVDPIGLVIQEDGSLLVTSYSRRTILRVEPTGGVSIFADGLAYRPLRLEVYRDGYLVSVSDDDGQRGDAVYFLTKEGVVSNFVSHLYASGVAAAPDGRVYVASNVTGAVSEIRPATFTDKNSAPFRAAIRGAAEWAMSPQLDAGIETVRQVARVQILGEAASIENDASRRALYEEHMDRIAQRLRDEQNADGGWGWRPADASDSMVTAMAGIALEYTGPSRDDEVVRSTIEMLVDRQALDGSWGSENGIFHDRLAATGVVMSYLPQALERVGALDLVLNVVTGDGLENVTPDPVIETTPEGGLLHKWTFEGVARTGRDIGFDIPMNGMLAGEQRGIADAAWLEFRNSFNTDVVRMDLAVPVVKAVSGMGVSVDTGAVAYDAQAPVLITGMVSNLRPTDESATVQVAIRVPGGDEVLADAGVIVTESIPPNGSTPFSIEWNTGTTLPGELEVAATLIDATGNVVDTAIAPFSITTPVSVVTAGISTDSRVYGGFDVVRLSARVRNITTNTPRRSMRGVLTVTAPGGEVLLSRFIDMPPLAPNGYIDIPDSVTLNDAVTGEYAVHLVIQDAISRVSLASTQVTFSVARHAADALMANTVVAHNWVYRGDANTCTHNLQNRGGIPLDIEIVHQLVSLEGEAVLLENRTPLSLAAHESTIDVRGVDTRHLEPGAYGCRVLVNAGEFDMQRSAAGFGIAEPPIRIVPAMNAGTRGRLLVLLDPACADLDPAEAEGGACDADPHGPDFAAPLPVQREHIEAVLDSAGWTYTIVTNAADFEAAFNSKGYELYALFNEAVKLPEALQRDVVADIAAGRGLLVAGNHDRRNGRLEEALGIKSLGKNLEVEALVIEPFGEHVGGELAFDVAHWPNTVSLDGAEVLGEFRVPQKGKKAVAPEPALTRHAHESGTGAYASFDWPAQSAMQGDDGELAGLLVATLDVTHPDPYAAIAGRTFALHVTLQNEGMATPGQVHIALPEGVSLVGGPPGTVTTNGIAAWTFALSEEEQRGYTLWLKLPEATGPLTLEAVIYAGEGDALTEHVRTQTVLNVQPQE